MDCENTEMEPLTMSLFTSAIDGQMADMQTVLGFSRDASRPGDSIDKKMTPLHYAAWYNKCEVIETLVCSNVDVNARDAELSTPLHYAARYKQRTLQSATGHVTTTESSRKVLRALVEAGADVNATNSFGDSPLSMAVVRGNAETVDELINTPGVDIESCDKRKWTPLHLAAKFERLEIAKMLLKAGANVRSRTENEITPLMLACAEGDVAMANLILKSAPMTPTELVNDGSVDMESAIDYAIENQKTEAARLCIEHGCNLMKTCRENQLSPLHLAAIAGDANIAAMVIEGEKNLVRWQTTNNSLPLHLAASHGKTKVVKLLIENGADMEACDNENHSPLLVAVMHGHFEVVRHLLEKGANVSALTHGDQSAIHLAATNNKFRSLAVLLEFIARDEVLQERMVSADDRLGNSPLHLGAEKGYLQVVKMLLAAGADIENINEEEEMPIHVAAAHGKASIVRELVNTADDPILLNYTQEEGNTPLHLAAIGGHVNVVECLLENNCDFTIRNRQFLTPLACAADFGQIEVVEQLIKVGSDITTRDRTGQTALHLAAKKNHGSVVKLLIDHNALVSAKDNAGFNPLDVAIMFANTEAAMAIVKSEQWREALRNKTLESDDAGEWYSTPLRKLICKMPDVVEEVFDRCVSYPLGLDIKDPELEIEMDFEFVDDTYSCSTWGAPTKVKVRGDSDNVYASDGTVLPSSQPYTTDSLILDDNHPLQILVSNKRGELLYHPLILGLVRHKWRLAQFSYFSFLAFYCAFVAVLTTFMVAQKPPFMYNQTLLAMEPGDNTSYCELLYSSLRESRTVEPHVSLFYVAAIMIWLMCLVGMSIEVMQLYSTPRRYFQGATNLLDWFTYISAAIVVTPIDSCFITKHWQWQLGAASMFIAWMDLILFLRRLPGVGIYIVMVGEVFVTFIKFFVFCFSLFIFAFGFTFFVLLQNQVSFETPFLAFVKTMVMMVGEMDFGDIFHGDEDDYESKLFYPGAAYFSFLCFICMATIIIMNLLTGLAVGDVQEIQEQAKLKKLAMQVELAMDIEISLTENLRRYFKCVVGFLRMSPNKMDPSCTQKLSRFMSGPLSSRSIAKALYNEADEKGFDCDALESWRNREKEQLDNQVMTQEGDEDGGTSRLHLSPAEQIVMTKVDTNTRSLAAMSQKLDLLENLLRKMLESSGVQLAGTGLSDHEDEG